MEPKKEMVSLGSLSELISEVRAALADGRITIFDAMRLAALIMGLVRSQALGLEMQAEPVKFSVESLAKVWETVRDAVADKRITLREAISIAHELIGLVREFLGETPIAGDPDFGFATE